MPKKKSILRSCGLSRTKNIAFLIVLMSCILAPAATFAQTSERPQITSMSVDDKNDFVLEPGKMEIFADPGDTIVKYISVTSRINRKTDFKVTTEDFVGSREEQNPVVLLGDDRSPNSFKDSLRPAVSDFTLNFGDRITIPITIQIPANALPGGYYSSVIVANGPQNDSSTSVSGAQIISRVGVLFFVRVNGPVNESGFVEDFRISDKHWIYETSPDKFQILFNNTGSVHLAPYGVIRISNLFGSEIGVLPIDAYFSLPDSLRYRDVNWADDSFRIGRYKATLELNRGYGDIIDTKVLAFWILPWKILLAVGGGLVLLILISYFFLSRFEFRRKQ